MTIRAERFYNLGMLGDVEITEPAVANQGIWFDAVSGKWVNGAAWEESWPTGLANGGELNISEGGIEVIAGLGVISDTYTDPLAPPDVIGVRWDQVNEPITAAPAQAGSIVWFSIYNTGVLDEAASRGRARIFVGALRQYAEGPSPTLAKQEVFLGVAIHNGIEWKEVSNPKVINQAAETLRELATNVLPLSSIISGGAVTELPGFQVQQQAGVIWEQNRNWHNDKSDPNREALPAASPVVFQYVNRDFSDVGAPTSEFDPAIWDDGGIVSPTPGAANATTIQKLYIDPADNYWVLLGQITYANFFTAEANLKTDLARSVIPFMLQNSILLGFAVSEKGKTDWDIDEAVFVPANGPSGQGGGGGVPITVHNNLTDRDAADGHPVTALEHFGAVDDQPVEPGTAIVWTGTEWQSLNLFVTSGYGGVLHSAAPALPDIGAGWTVLLADTGSIAVPRGVTQDTANNALRLNTEGVWSISISFSLTHNEANGDRTFSVRVYDVDSASAGRPTLVGVGRNSTATIFGVTLLRDVPASNVGDAYRVEVGGTTDSITAVVQNNFAMSATLVSEYRG